MAIPGGGALVSKPLTLGTIQLRDYGNVLDARPRWG
jgi:hypothetical protein